MSLCQLAQEFVRSLEQLQQITDAPATTSTKKETVEQSQSTDILQRSLQLQTQFQEILAIVATDGINPQTEARLRPLQTEAHRRLRLLSMEATKLKTAKQPATIEKTRSQLTQHLTSLMQFAQAIQSEACE